MPGSTGLSVLLLQADFNPCRGGGEHEQHPTHATLAFLPTLNRQHVSLLGQVEESLSISLAAGLRRRNSTGGICSILPLINFTSIHL